MLNFCSSARELSGGLERSRGFTRDEMKRQRDRVAVPDPHCAEARENLGSRAFLLCTWEASSLLPKLFTTKSREVSQSVLQENLQSHDIDLIAVEAFSHGKYRCRITFFHGKG